MDLWNDEFKEDETHTFCMDFHNLNCRKFQHMKTIMCHGDSLTEGSDLEKNYTWPHLVENQIQVTVLNRGIGGDTSGGLLSRFYPDVVRYQPEIVVILGGTNDLWWDLDINLILANIFAMASQAQYRNIVPIVGLPLPLHLESIRHQNIMAPIGGWDKCLNKLSDLVDKLALAAKESDIACLDFYHPFLDRNEKVQGKYFLEDGLHPNKQGHRLMAEIMVELLRHLFYFS